ncbi:uncharacterized protein F4807DRAFT_416797, partial [Annulohypoxylon truncatum]|uniref:uncharacterized protein n=1 Tax=Annulohypoxylon truncatum TaxID=327061 RepID=UPI00200754AA
MSQSLTVPLPILQLITLRHFAEGHLPFKIIHSPMAHSRAHIFGPSSTAPSPLPNPEIGAARYRHLPVISMCYNI